MSGGKRWLIVGCGYVGEALGRFVLKEGLATDVVGVRRSQPSSALPFPCIAAACDAPDFASHLPAGAFDRVVFCAAAKQSDPQAYERTYAQGAQGVVRALQAHQRTPARFLFTSSTAVYEADDGSHVDEATATKPHNFRGQVMLRAEEAFLRSGWPAVVLRLGGIYGPERTGLLRRVRSGQAKRPSLPAYANRIHRDDCAQALAHLGGLTEPQGLYVGVDSAPVDRGEVLLWLTQQLGLPPPEVEQTSQITGKRCSNARLRASGYSFCYPSYREGYAPSLLA